METQSRIKKDLTPKEEEWLNGVLDFVYNDLMLPNFPPDLEKEYWDNILQSTWNKIVHWERRKDNDERSHRTWIRRQFEHEVFLGFYKQKFGHPPTLKRQC